jgi:putative ATP-binding cassette transporter
MESVRQIENLGLLLDQCAPEAPATAPVARWQQIEFVDVTHAYRREGRPHGFVLGPFQLTLSPGEIIFVIGGNGSGKTTLAKLITGLYVPETGRVRLDGRSIVSENREGYRQLFSAVFDDAMVFDNLWGIAAEGRDQTAHEHLRRLQLDHLVSVSNGAFSTTALSRGQRKRLALLTAYLEDRLIYVFDEWAADQDPVFRKFFYLNLLPELKARGKTVVAITHDDRYFGTADRVIKLDEGKVVEIMRHESIEEYQCEIV